MATVYLARDLKHDRPVAIKVVHPELAQALGSERFLREIQIAASLNHPHILPLLDSGAVPLQNGTTDGPLWYAMPYVEGESLRARLIREKQLPLLDALRIARNVAAALAYAHARGIIHRDIKPENILLAGEEALVADFGIARAITAAGGDKLTPSGLAVGTPAYMSPEQAAGERELDGRTDIYSLGCVLYEMLAGEPPFTGPTVQAILAKRLGAPTPSLHLVRDTVPLELEASIRRALARVPADRFATAAELADALALQPAPHAHHRRERDRHRWIVPAAALAVAGIILVTVILRSPGGRPPRVDPDLLAVAPFDVRATPLKAWSEGLVDVLSRTLDGAGSLRTVAPTVALKGWTGLADPASAAALGQRTGAGLVVFGALELTASDSVRIWAALLDASVKAAPLEVEVRGDTLRMDQLVDSLAIVLLRELGRTRPVGAVRQSPLGAKSLPALKAFLRGEQYYRQSLWDSALVQYDRALGLDSTFALAYRRMSLVVGWNSAAATAYRPGEEYVRRAAAFNHGLAPRDSLLILSDSLLVLGLDPQTGSPFVSRRRLFSTLAEARQRYPGDPEVWYAVGEARFHSDDQRVASKVEALQAFDRAIALDSAFTPAYFHTPGLAIDLDQGEPSRARRYLAAYLRLNPKDDNSAPLRLTATLLDSSLGGSSETARLIDTAPARVLWSVAIEHLAHWPDSAETAVRVLRSLVAGRHSTTGPPSDWSDSSLLRRALASALTFRGHLREAYRTHSVFAARYPDRFLNPYVRLALLGAVPAETAAAAFQRSLERDPPQGASGLVLVLPWWLSRRDTVTLARFAALYDSLALRASLPLGVVLRRYGSNAARAYARLARGDSAAALRGFASLPDSVCGDVLDGCSHEKFIQARLLRALGQDRQSFELLERWRRFDPEVVLEWAQLADRFGYRERAIRGYQFVLNAWRRADPALQPYIVQARSGLERLLGEPSQRAAREQLRP